MLDTQTLNRHLQFDKLYLDFALSVASLSRCNRKKVGAVLVKDNNILSYGFNGTPSGMCNDCEDVNGNTLPIVLHAEANALAKCLLSENSPKDSTLYVTLSPCMECSKLLIQSGVKKVWYLEEYRNVEGIELLKQNRITVNKWV